MFKSANRNNTNSKFLKIKQISQEDTGKGIIKINPEVIKELALNSGDPIEIINNKSKRRTAARVFPQKEKLIETQKSSFYDRMEEEFDHFEPPSSQKIHPPSSQMLELTVTQLDGTLQTLLASVPELKAATIVSTKGKPIASALPQGVDESKIANMMVPLLSLAEKAIVEMKQGEFEQLYVKGKEGYLLVLPAGPNAVLSVSTTKDVRLGLIILECQGICEKIVKLI